MLKYLHHLTERNLNMKFTKMHGAGNDFIIINNMEEKLPVESLGELAKKLCHRKLSIGADGLMVVDYPDSTKFDTEKGDNKDTSSYAAPADYRMRFYNSDGSLGEMCGNGARCIARYGYEKGLAGETQRIQTTAGLVTGERITETEYRIRLNDVTKMEHDVKMHIDDRDYKCDYIELGNPAIPHIAVRAYGLQRHDDEWLCAAFSEFCSDNETGAGEPDALVYETDSKLFHLGRKMRYYEKFPKGANVNFYDIIGEDQLVEFTYERGVEDFTLACGTGTGSVVAALTDAGLVSGKNVQVTVPGGLLIIDIKEEGLFLTGPTMVVCEGDC